MNEVVLVGGLARNAKALGDSGRGTVVQKELANTLYYSRSCSRCFLHVFSFIAMI